MLEYLEQSSAQIADQKWWLSVDKTLQQLWWQELYEAGWTARENMPGDEEDEEWMKVPPVQQGLDGDRGPWPCNYALVWEKRLKEFEERATLREEEERGRKRDGR